MDTKVAEKIIKQIARENFTTEEEVRSEMKAAILAGYQNTETRTKWNEVFGEGNLPTPEQFIMIISRNLIYGYYSVK